MNCSLHGRSAKSAATTGDPDDDEDSSPDVPHEAKSKPSRGVLAVAGAEKESHRQAMDMAIEIDPWTRDY